MPIDDDALLKRLAASASEAPCQVSRSDMVGLLGLAQIGPQAPLWREVHGSSDDPITIMPNLVLMMVGWVRNLAAQQPQLVD